ncbi:hypothetical protein [Mycobacterium sp. SP-6446]|uniref:hypothetical protein n=1 Tax=Mycobacterium sp. SP-6446 TaxID=1834162 RepID=UPI00097A94EB|nr:hypothetical protein [Mycobacterium sp. SP-6446]OMC14958.1 hypothetical protein A5736_20470 [Mycobacterium sp. SP-6446]
MPPTLSQLQAWDTDHLINAATYWTTAADQWEDAFTQIRNQSHTMGWDGEGGDALRTRAAGDLKTVSAKADQLRNAARIARTGASNISAAQRQALYAVEDAQRAGFRVGEDLSVTDTRTSRNAAEAAARQAQAQTFAANINARAAQLLGVETDTSGQITTAAGDVGATNFTGAPAKGHGGVQLVDNTQGGDDSNGGVPQLPRHDPPIGRWDGPPPPGWHPGTGYWALDPNHPADSPDGLPNPSLYQSDPPCVRPDLLTGPSTGVTSVGGGSDNPQRGRAWGWDLQGTSRVRVSGTEFNGITKAVQINGRWYQAQWQEYQYQLNTIPVMEPVGPVGVTMPDMSQANVWRPISLGQLMDVSKVYPEATIHLPNLNGGVIDIKNGWWAGSTGIPTPPVMTRGN